MKRDKLFVQQSIKSGMPTFDANYWEAVRLDLGQSLSSQFQERITAARFELETCDNQFPVSESECVVLKKGGKTRTLHENPKYQLEECNIENLDDHMAAHKVDIIFSHDKHQVFFCAPTEALSKLITKKANNEVYDGFGAPNEQLLKELS